MQEIQLSLFEQDRPTLYKEDGFDYHSSNALEVRQITFDAHPLLIQENSRMERFYTFLIVSLRLNSRDLPYNP